MVGVSTRIEMGDELHPFERETTLKSLKGIEFAKRLERLGAERRSAVIKLRAEQLRYCSAAQNIWLARDLDNGEGELYDGFGTYACCGLAYCPFCGRNKHRRTARRLSNQLDSSELPNNKLWYSVTLTAPIARDQPLLTCIRVFQTAWLLLRKRKWWIETALAGIKSIEWTVSTSAGGNNVHIHAVLLCNRNLERDTLQSTWTEVIDKAWQREKVTLTFPTRSNLANVNIRRIPGGRATSTINPQSLRDEIEKLIAYQTKGSKWGGLADSDIISMVEMERLPRLIDSFGELRTAPGSTLDNKYINGGGRHNNLEKQQRERPSRKPTLCQRAISLPPLQWQTLLAEAVAREREYRRRVLIERYPYATFCDLSDLS